MRLNPVGMADLEVFFAVAEAGSFSRAAAMLEMSQPAVTQRIHKLEAFLGLQLFDRTTRRVSLTEAGERLADRARDAVRDLRQVWKDLRDEADLKVGRVMLGAAPTVAATRLPRVITLFMRRHPGMRVGLYDDFVNPVLARLNSGALDLAVIPDDGIPETFRSERLYVEDLAIAVPRAWGLPTDRAMSFQEFAVLPFVLMPEPSGIRKAIERIFEQAGHPFAPVLEAHSLRTLIGLAREGLGVTVLTLDTLATEPSLVRVRVEGLVFERHIALVTVSGRSLSAAARACAALIRRELRAKPPGP